MGLGIRVEKTFDMIRCGCEMTSMGQGKASDSDVAAKALGCTCNRSSGTLKKVEKVRSPSWLQLVFEMLKYLEIFILLICLGFSSVIV